MLNNLTLIPAYGRKYANVDKAVEDWNVGKDFLINELECYCSIRDTLQFQRDLYFVSITINGETRNLI